ncbi:MAG TPA: M48 family metallopeptidase [Pyrinomonadaceae bacterium]|nr:M48 family metallopeptidase [Pyrinomonadaceae bacterium]
MNRHFFRTVTALSLVATIGLGSLPAAAAPRRQQTQTAGQPTARKAADAKPAPSPAAATANKPLSEKEDPRMIGKRNINNGTIFTNGGSLEKEVNLGRQLAAEIDRQAKFVDDAVISEYVNRVGQNVVLHSDSKIPFTIKVIDSDEANAFALPGGFFYVNKGLILAAENEAELAGVMAHEIAHVAARHAMENQRKGMWMDIGLLAGSIFLGGVPGLLINNLGGLGALAAFMKFSRGAEEEADRLGVQYLWAAGYDPNSMSTMFEKLLAKNKKKPGTLSKLFATHPQTTERMEASRALVARFPDREEYILSTSEFQRVKARLMRLSNARASTAGDIGRDESGGAPGRPTLKRRSPNADDTTTPDGQPKPEQSAPPTLKRGGDKPQPTSSPTP